MTAKVANVSTRRLGEGHWPVLSNISGKASLSFFVFPPPMRCVPV